MKKQILISTFLTAALLIGLVVIASNDAYAQDGGALGSGGGRSQIYGSGSRSQIYGSGTRQVSSSSYLASGHRDGQIVGPGARRTDNFGNFIDSGYFADNGGMLGSGTLQSTGGLIGSGTFTSDGGGGMIGSGTLSGEDDGGGGTIGSGTRSGVIGSGTRTGTIGPGGGRTTEDASFLSTIMRFFGF
jgi:hypothetical protein